MTSDDSIPSSESKRTGRATTWSLGGLRRRWHEGHNTRRIGSWSEPSSSSNNISTVMSTSESIPVSTQNRDTTLPSVSTLQSPVTIPGTIPEEETPASENSKVSSPIVNSHTPDPTCQSSEAGSIEQEEMAGKPDQYSFIPNIGGKHALEREAGFDKTDSTYKYTVYVLGQWRKGVPEITKEMVEEGYTAPTLRQSRDEKWKGRKYFVMLTLKGSERSVLMDDLERGWKLMELYYGKDEGLKEKVKAWTSDWAGRNVPLCVEKLPRSTSLVKPPAIVPVRGNTFLNRLVQDFSPSRKEHH